MHQYWWEARQMENLRATSVSTLLMTGQIRRFSAFSFLLMFRKLFFVAFISSVCNFPCHLEILPPFDKDEGNNWLTYGTKMKPLVRELASDVFILLLWRSDVWLGGGIGWKFVVTCVFRRWFLSILKEHFLDFHFLRVQSNVCQLDTNSMQNGMPFSYKFNANFDTFILAHYSMKTYY